MSTQMIQWYMLPGMGATSSMYDALRPEVDFNVEFINWPEYHGEKTYEEVARRVIKENEILQGDIVGGSSLGGMVALEIAQIIGAKAVILIGSALNRKEVKPLLTMLSPLASVTPLSLIQSLAGKQEYLVTRMFAESNPEFIRAMCTYLTKWQGFHGSAKNVFRIHGKKDHVIACPVADSEFIEDAGHLLAITHPKETAAFIRNSRTCFARFST